MERVIKLEQWIVDSGMTKAEFAARIGVFKETLDRYLRRARMPQPDVMKRIKEVTGGEITADDFY